MSIFSIALAFFLITNPIGNSPAILACVKDFSLREQRLILMREAILSGVFGIVFLYLGIHFMNLVNLHDYTISLTGGSILVLVAIGMIFPKREELAGTNSEKRMPILVPIATPLLCGGGLLATIVLYSQQEGNPFKIFLALVLSTIAVTTVLLLAPTLQVILGKRGMIALEQLMGLLLAMLSTELLVKGTALFIKSF
jgi:multiple antibiotic resistance protein